MGAPPPGGGGGTETPLTLGPSPTAVLKHEPHSHQLFPTQHCTCVDDCSSSNCLCGQLSIRCWYDKVRVP